MPTPRFSDHRQKPEECQLPGAAQAAEGQTRAGVAIELESIGSGSRWRGASLVLMISALLLTLATLASPRVPDESDTAATADVSWSAVLQYAHEHRLQFGTDIVFTYGPLGFLATPYASSASVGRLATDFLLTLLSATGICLIAGRLGVVRGLVLMGVYLFLLGNIYPRTDLLIELNLLCWTLLCARSFGRSLIMYVLVLASVAAFAALVKITLLVIACLTLAAVSCCLVLRGYRFLSWTLPALALIGFVTVWTGIGQNPLNLGGFLYRALITSQGYNNAMGYEGSVVLRGRGLLTGLLTLAAILLAVARFNLKLNWKVKGHQLSSLIQKARDQRLLKELLPAGTETTQAAETEKGIAFTLQRGLLFCWASAMLFLVWKHGFVRTDLYHAGFFFGFAPVLALSFGGVLPQATKERQDSAAGTIRMRFLHRVRRTPGPAVWEGVFTAGCCLVSVFTVQTMILPGNWKSSLREPFHAIPVNLYNLARPAGYREQLSGALEAERQRYQLPTMRRTVGRSTVDMFGCEQIAVLANDFDYRPRPVFQTYAAYSSPLMRWNELFYQSASRPEFVLFHLMSLDHKLPALEDALLLRNLLINYELTGSEVPFLLLKSARHEAPSLKLLREGTFQVGEKLSLDEFDDANLWLELDIQSTFLGHLRQFFYQPAKSRLLVWSNTPAVERLRRFRAPPLMLSAGFLVSPLTLNNDDVVRLYQGGETKRPSAIGVELNPGDEKLWRKIIGYRLYRLNNKLGAGMSSNS